MKSTKTILCILVLILLIVLIYLSLRKRRCDRGMEALWVEHVCLTRAFIIESKLNYPAAGKTAELLLHNCYKLGQNLGKLINNKEIGTKYGNLLQEHIKIAANIVSLALKKEDISPQVKEWYNNGNDIAVYLSEHTNVCPKEIKAAFKDHLDVTTKELVAILSDDYDNSVKYFKQAESHGIHMSHLIFSEL